MTAASSRAVELASAFEGAVEDFATFLETLSPEQWRTVVPGEERTVAALARGWGFGYEMIAFTAFAAGLAFTTVPRAELNALNAANGAEYAECPKDDTIAFLRTEAATASEAVRKFTSGALSRTGLYVEGMPEMTVERLIERVLIGHVVNHQRGIREALGLAPANG